MCRVGAADADALSRGAGAGAGPGSAGLGAAPGAPCERLASSAAATGTMTLGGVRWAIAARRILAGHPTEVGFLPC